MERETAIEEFKRLMGEQAAATDPAPIKAAADSDAELVIVCAYTPDHTTQQTLASL